MNTSNSRSPGLTRRGLIAAGAAVPLFTILKSASAAEFEYKFASGVDPTHPVHVRLQEAINRIREATSGRLDIKLFPSGQLGADTDLLNQVRSGAVEFYCVAGSVLASFVPVSGISATGFAFKDYDTVWKAMDGDLGSYIRAQIEKTSITAVSRVWDNGFRQITSATREIKTPADLKGFKLRVPVAPMLTSLFTALDAGPAPINFSEVYMALQTKLVEGQENPLPIIATTRIYEVQRSCSLTNHAWDGAYMVANQRALKRLPKHLQEVVLREFDRSATDQRADIAALSISLRGELEGKGLRFIDVDQEPFRQALIKTTFYKDWKNKFGPEAWSQLEKYSGKLG